MNHARLVLPFSAVLIAGIAGLAGCHGPVVRTVEVSAAGQLNVQRPSVLYNLKRSRLDFQFDLRLVEVLTTKRKADGSWVPQRSEVYYLIDFGRAEGVKVTTSLEDDPQLGFAILTDSAESALTNIKNFEIKLQADGTLQSVNGDFEDTTLKVAANVAKAGLDLAKFAGNVAVTVASVVKSTEETKVEQKVLDTPALKAGGSILLKDFTDKVANVFSHSMLPLLNDQLEGAKAQLRLQHAAQNQILAAEVRKKLKEDAGKEIDKLDRPTLLAKASLPSDDKTPDADLKKTLKEAADREVDDFNQESLIAKGKLAQSHFFPDEVKVKNMPTALALSVTGDGIVNLQSGVALTSGAVVQAAITASKDSPEKKAKRTSHGGIFYRRAGKGRVEVVATGPGAAKLQLFAAGVTLPETGAISYTSVDSRLFTNRNILVSFDSKGELTGYKLVASSAAEAATKALADQTADVLKTLQGIETQKKTDADKAETDDKTDRQEIADQQLRENAQEDLIFAQQQKIALQERQVEYRRAELAEADVKVRRLEVDLNLASTPENQAKRSTAEQQLPSARREWRIASDNLFTAEAALEADRLEKQRREQKLEIIKSGLSISSTTTKT